MPRRNPDTKDFLDLSSLAGDIVNDIKDAERERIDKEHIVVVEQLSINQEQEEGEGVKILSENSKTYKFIKRCPKCNVLLGINRDDLVPVRNVSIDMGPSDNWVAADASADIPSSGIYKMPGVICPQCKEKIEIPEAKTIVYGSILSGPPIRYCRECGTDGYVWGPPIVEKKCHRCDGTGEQDRYVCTTSRGRVYEKRTCLGCGGKKRVKCQTRGEKCKKCGGKKEIVDPVYARFRNRF